MNMAPQIVVGIGASAGGVEAFRGFFNNMEPDSGLAFVVVLHLAPERKSLLPEILARWTKMPVILAAAHMLVQPNCVYVIPAGYVATILRMRLHLRPVSSEDRRQPTSIDIFFDSLAADLQERAVGIVLSGTGHDGALGLKAIREAGGLTIAQGSDGTAPQFTGMPASAIASGSVDLIIPVEQIPAHLLASRSVAVKLDAAAEAPAEDLTSIRLEICKLLLENLGHDFSNYKSSTFMRRVHRRMQMVTLQSHAAYIQRLREDRAEALMLFRELLIGVTSFFRDPDTFAFLSHGVIPQLFANKTADQSVRVWVAGCATGEEAYSLAMLLREYTDTLTTPPKLQVFATDLDEQAISAARAGRYPASLLRGISKQRLARFFSETMGGYIVSREIRDICTFSSHSLVRDPPFSRVDFISCRNLLIYLDNELQSRIIPIFHFALVPKGLLLLGSAETVARHEDLFATIDKKHRIYQRNNAPGTLPPLPFRMMNMADQKNLYNQVQTAAERSWPDLVNRAKTRVLELHSPTFVVVTESGEIIHYSNRTGKFFEPSPGAPSKNLFDMARLNIRIPLRAAVRAAIENGRGRAEQQVALVDEGQPAEPFTISVETLPSDAPEKSFLIVFKNERITYGTDAAVDFLSHDELQVTAALERENRDLREQMQSIGEEHSTAVEQLRSTNEELHSVNEELQSSNEELETSREEIQSINEEMNTVNAELSSKLEELDRANSDLKNLFESTRVATIFLDQHLIIRAFTPEVATIYNLIPSDIGRPLTDIFNRLNYHTLRADVAQVLSTLEPLERRVSREDGSSHYLMRLLPYRSPDSRIGGTLVTFIEVTSIVQAEQHQRLLVDELNHRVKNMLTVVISLASQTLRRAGSLEAFSGVFLGRIHALTAAYELLSRRSWEDVALKDVLSEELKPFMSETRDSIVMNGPAVALDARAALAIGMAIHELTTNAAKYGALSVPEGDLHIQWAIEETAGEPMFHLRWEEKNGPPVKPDVKPGFGMILIERGLSYDLGGQARVEFLPEGIRATLHTSLRRLTSHVATAGAS